MNRSRAMTTTAAILLAGAALLAGCHHEDAEAPAAAPQVVVIRPQRGEAIRSITLPGDAVGYYQSALYAKVTGYLKDIQVDKGDPVKKGEVLANIEVPELRQRLDRARSNLEIQRLTYDRLDKVWKEDPRLVARQDVDMAFSKFQQAQAEYNELAAMVAYTQIVAPFDGIVTERFVDPGALIRAGGQDSATAPMEGTANAGGSAAPVVSVADISKLRVYVYVPQDAVGYVRVGMPVRLEFRELPGHTYMASVARFAHSLDFSTRTMLTEIDLDNSRREIYPGMYANATLELERHGDAIKLPDSAVADSPNGGHFVLVARGGRLEEVPVTIGINTGIYMEITSGLSGSEKVVRSLTAALSSGEQVRTVLDNHYQLGFQPELVKANRN
ncbi:MAG TPA: efflux RND transporter periplasmic adaptor subunit [Candidatus Binataceae bacterium]|nr:efflux RND transporter periplasmic adaptor subunit [Candidatus Binataceae bacterium]